MYLCVVLCYWVNYQHLTLTDQMLLEMDWFTVEPRGTCGCFICLCMSQNAAKQAAAAATQTIAAAQNAAASNKNTAAHQQLVQSCKVRINADRTVPLSFWCILWNKLKFEWWLYDRFLTVIQTAFKPAHMHLCVGSGRPHPTTGPGGAWQSGKTRGP